MQRFVVVVLFAGSLSAGCVPIVNTGYLSSAPRRAGAVDLQLHAGGGYPHYGWGSVHVEPFASSKLSIPIGLSGSAVLDGGGGALRVGLRHRTTRLLKLGGGLGGTASSDASFAGLLDFELGLGDRWERFGLSLGFRPTWIIPSAIVYFPFEVAAAIFVSRRWAVTLLAYGGPAVIGSVLPARGVRTGV